MFLCLCTGALNFRVVIETVSEEAYVIVSARPVYLVMYIVVLLYRNATLVSGQAYRCHKKHLENKERVAIFLNPHKGSFLSLPGSQKEIFVSEPSDFY